MTRPRRPKTRVIHNRSGGRVVVEHRRIPTPIVADPDRIIPGSLQPIGPTAKDCEDHLRGRTRFPMQFWEARG